MICLQDMVLYMEVSKMFVLVFYEYVIKIIVEEDVGSSGIKRGGVSGKVCDEWKGKGEISMIR